MRTDDMLMTLPDHLRAEMRHRWLFTTRYKNDE